jgi:hypothetical protein
LRGIVFGNERVEVGDDIEYVGEMTLQTDIDLCEGTGASESKLCTISVDGTASVGVQLAIYFDDRGAYIETGAASQPPQVKAFGSCGSTADAEERAAFPDNSMANPFDGIELEWPPGRASGDARLPLSLADHPPGDRTVWKGETGSITFQVVRVVPGGVAPPRP